MLGELIESLDNPEVAMRLIATLDNSALTERLATIAECEGRPQWDVVCFAVRRFIDTASDDHWLQLIGIMNRAEDPGLAAMHAILAAALAEKGP